MKTKNTGWSAILLSFCMIFSSSAQQNMQFTSIAVRQPPNIALTGSGYTVESVGNESRFLWNGYHFLSIQISQGLVVRPHPGMDPNGWGSTPYLSPFLPGATLRACTVNSVTTGSNGIHMFASGPVYQGPSGAFGTWQVDITFAFDPVGKEISGEGVLSINLEGPLSSGTGDLNVVRIASNMLDGVPTYSGSSITGDMSGCHVSGTGFAAFDWQPILQPGHFPQERSSAMTISVTGAVNDVKTAAMGECPIQIAVKPSVELTLTSRNQVPMIFGGLFATAKKSDPYADNVGITPLVVRGDTQATDLVFDLTYRSLALPEDGSAVEADLSASFFPVSGQPPASLDVFYSTTLDRGSFDRLVGSLPMVSPGLYLGTVPVPKVSAGTGGRGFFRATEPCH